MKLSKHLIAVVSTLFLLTACETPSDVAGGTETGGTGADANGNYEPGSIPDFVNRVGDRVFFDYDSSVIDSEAQSTLDAQAAWLKQYGDYSITVEGHCDERGTREYNLALGERRSAAAKNYLVSLGVPASRVSTISYGKERPAVVGSDEGSWAQNRRAVTVLGN